MLIQLLYIATMLSGVAATLCLLVGLGSASGAPQQAAAAGIAIAIVAIPYVFTRSVQIVRDRHDEKQHRERIEDILDAIRQEAAEKALGEASQLASRETMPSVWQSERSSAS